MCRVDILQSWFSKDTVLLEPRDDSYLYFKLQHSPKNYAFGYAVKDDYTGDDYSHKESRDGYTTSGEYRVCL